MGFFSKKVQAEVVGEQPSKAAKVIHTITGVIIALIVIGCLLSCFYTINDVSSIAMPNDETGKLTKMRGRCVVINGLRDTKRTNGKTWFDELTRIIIPWEKQ